MALDLNVTLSKITDTNNLLHNPMTTAIVAMKKTWIVTCFITTIMSNFRFFLILKSCPTQ